MRLIASHSNNANDLRPHFSVFETDIALIRLSAAAKNILRTVLQV